MKVLITGAAGFIGSHMAERMAQSGFDVMGPIETNYLVVVEPEYG